MASALALGWNEPALVADIDLDKAARLADAIGGSVAQSNAALAEEADIVVLCHKPAQLEGGMQRIADKVFLLTPRNVDVSAEERARLIEKGFFNQS